MKRLEYRRIDDDPSEVRHVLVTTGKVSFVTPVIVLYPAERKFEAMEWIDTNVHGIDFNEN